MSSALAADLSAADVRGQLAAVGVNPGTSREVGGEIKTITLVEVSPGKRRGEFIIRVHIDDGHGRRGVAK